MGYAEYQPHADLRHRVKCFWSIDDPASSEVQEVWPDGCLELLFTPGNNFLVAAGGQAEPFPTVCVLGLQTRILRVRTEGAVRLLGARMLPGALGDWDHGALLALGARIQPLLRAARFCEAVAVLEPWLLRRPPVDSTLAAAIRSLYSAAGNVTVADLARSQGLSSRQLQRSFAARLGLSPKTLSKLVRFAESWSRLLQKPDLPLAELALDLGYSDQAHFSNEFASFGNQSPGRFRRAWSPAGAPHSPSAQGAPHSAS